MSMRYKGAVISATPPTTSTTTATGVWTLPQQMQAQGAGNWPAPIVNYIEDMFSTYLYTGNATARSITNGIDLVGQGGLVWIKTRSPSGYSPWFFDTNRGAGYAINSDFNGAQNLYSSSLTSFNSNGFSLGTDSDGTGVNSNTLNIVSWTFRKQPKFFDVVTYTGTGANRTISHNLGSVPGCIIVKRTDTSANWAVYHTSLANTEYLVLNSTAAKATGATWWNSTTPTSSVFSIGTDASVNASGGTYVAYLFASNAGGFGTSGNDNVITCGSFTTVSSGYSPNVELGYEPQWIMLKRTDSTGDWLIVDTMRGWVNPAGTSANDANLRPNTSDAEATNDIGWPYATGFNAGYRGGAESTWIYIAIRRGPMKVPTVGTSVYNAIARTGTDAVAQVTGVGFPPDLVATGVRSSGGSVFNDRLRGPGYVVYPFSTSAENYQSTGVTAIGQNGISLGIDVNGYVNALGFTYINWFFQRAPGFFDEVCYTGTGSATTFAHNLGVVPELMIVKNRNGVNPWPVYAASQTAINYATLNSTSAFNTAGSSTWNNTTPTSSVFSVGNSAEVNGSGSTYVAYLFATCPGVSKVGSYSGTGATQTINCGFTGGARFVLIKRTDSTGDWYVWDTARGMVAGTDPSLLLNSTAAEVNANSVYTTGVGFQIVSTAAGVNASGGTYIFWAVA